MGRLFSGGEKPNLAFGLIGEAAEGFDGVNSNLTMSNEGREGERAPGSKGGSGVLGGSRRAGAFGLTYTTRNAANNFFAQT